MIDSQGIFFSCEWAVFRNTSQFMLRGKDNRIAS
jgi:hypothetical protein